MNVPSYPSLCQMFNYHVTQLDSVPDMQRLSNQTNKFEISCFTQFDLIRMDWLPRTDLHSWLNCFYESKEYQEYLCFHSFFFNFWLTSDGLSAFDVLRFLRYSTLDKWETIKGQLKVIWSAFNKFQIVKDNYI